MIEPTLLGRPYRTPEEYSYAFESALLTLGLVGVALVVAFFLGSSRIDAQNFRAEQRLSRLDSQQFYQRQAALSAQRLKNWRAYVR